MGEGRWSRTSGRLVLGFVVLVLAAGAARAQDEEEGPAVPPGLSYGVEATLSYHNVNHAYFGAAGDVTGDPDDSDFAWTEGFTRLRLNYGLPQGLWVSAGGVLMTTFARDYYGTDGTGDGLLDQLAVGIEDIGGSGLSLTAGRQDLQVGDGFVIGDGYYDHKAALWNIPLNFYDGVRADFERGPWHALAFGADLSPSFGEEGATIEGLLYGGELGWRAGEEHELAAGYFQRADDGTADVDARALSLRAALTLGAVRLGGELVEQSGQCGETDLAGRGGHAEVTCQLPAAGEPYAQLQYLQFSGDDPETSEDEGYQPWQYRCNDWSQWYVGDLVSSTLLGNHDARIWKLEFGWAPCEQTGLRLLLHRLDLDTGASYGALPEGVGRGFADECDLVVDRELNDNWSLWVMGGYARPREAAEELVGTGAGGQVFASIIYSFEGPGSGGE